MEVSKAQVPAIFMRNKLEKYLFLVKYKLTRLSY